MTLPSNRSDSTYLDQGGHVSTHQASKPIIAVQIQLVTIESAQLAFASDLKSYIPLVAVSSVYAGFADSASPPEVKNRVLSATAVPI